jgi:CRISPR-associated exonuclease Cas4
MTLILLGFAFILLLLAAAALIYARRAARQSGLPAGQVVYSDTGGWEKVEHPLLSRRYGLVGKPDYLVSVREGNRAMLIPVEVKSRRGQRTPDATAAPHHILQLATYCLLVEDVHNVRPPYGLLRYADATIRIDYTDELRAAVLQTADAIRRGRHAADVHRDHDDPARCRPCGYRHACDEALTD